MRKCELVITLVSVITLFTTGVGAAVVDIHVGHTSYWPPDISWNFDYDEQVLTFNEAIYEIGSDPFSSYSGAHIHGYMDSDSTTVTVVMNVTNRTGLPWTSYLIELPGGMTDIGLVVDGSATSIEFPEVTYDLSYNRIEFSGLEQIADGESLTIRFDVWARTYKPAINAFSFHLKQNAIPEPTSISLLAVGVVTLLRKQRTWKRIPLAD